MTKGNDKLCRRGVICQVEISHRITGTLEQNESVFSPPLMYIVTLIKGNTSFVFFASTTKQKSVRIVSPLLGQSGRRRGLCGGGGVRREGVGFPSVVQQFRGDTPELLAFTCVVT